LTAGHSILENEKQAKKCGVKSAPRKQPRTGAVSVAQQRAPLEDLLNLNYFSSTSRIQSLSPCGRLYDDRIPRKSRYSACIPKILAHALRDELHVLNKSSGALVRTIAMTQPHSATVDGNDSLWIISGAQGSRVVQKYQVNADGSLTLLSTIAGLSNPLYAAVSPTSNLVVVADGGSSSQLKAFTNTATPMLQWTYRLAGGYANGPDVTNDKFFWQDGSSARSFGTGKWNQERACI
jgi:hypothetical protein